MVAWTAGLLVVVAAMLAVGHGPLAPPDLRHPATWADWAEGRTAPDAVMAVLRLVVLALAAYLFAVTALAVALRLGDAGRLVTAADVITLPFVRSVVQAGLGVGIATATVAGVVAHPVAPAAPTSADAAIVTDAPTIDPAPTITDPGHAPPVSDGPTVTRTSAAPTWTVAPGDHLWSIAERVLERELGRAPSEAEVVPYWHALIDANRGVFADPQNPDLIFTGQVLTLPASIRSGA